MFVIDNSQCTVDVSTGILAFLAVSNHTKYLQVLFIDTRILPKEVSVNVLLMRGHK